MEFGEACYGGEDYQCWQDLYVRKCLHTIIANQPITPSILAGHSHSPLLLVVLYYFFPGRQMLTSFVLVQIILVFLDDITGNDLSGHRYRTYFPPRIGNAFNVSRQPMDSGKLPTLFRLFHCRGTESVDFHTVLPHHGSCGVALLKEPLWASLCLPYP